MAEKKINGSTYRVEPVLATQAILLQARLARILGPAMAKLPAIIASRAAGVTEQAKAQGDVEAITAITEIFARCQPEEIADLVRDVAELAQVQRASNVYEDVIFDIDFTGKLGDVIPVVVFVLTVQFGDFFSGALANGRQQRTAKA